jgi:hypothetical protein
MAAFALCSRVSVDVPKALRTRSSSPTMSLWRTPHLREPTCGTTVPPASDTSACYLTRGPFSLFHIRSAVAVEVRIESSKEPRIARFEAMFPPELLCDVAATAHTASGHGASGHGRPVQGGTHVGRGGTRCSCGVGPPAAPKARRPRLRLAGSPLVVAADRPDRLGLPLRRLGRRIGEAEGAVS